MTFGEHVYGTLRYLTTTPVPEPSSTLLLAMGLLSLAGMARVLPRSARRALGR